MVPGMVATGADVVRTRVFPETTTELIVSPLIVLGGIVVPGMVVVKVTSSPSAVNGITAPTPESVNWVGSVSVDWVGFDSEEADP